MDMGLEAELWHWEGTSGAGQHLPLALGGSSEWAHSDDTLGDRVIIGNHICQCHTTAKNNRISGPPHTVVNGEEIEHMAEWQCCPHPTPPAHCTLLT